MAETTENTVESFVYRIHATLKEQCTNPTFEMGFRMTSEQRQKLRTSAKVQLQEHDLLGVPFPASEVETKVLPRLIRDDAEFRKLYDACPNTEWANRSLVWLCRNIVIGERKPKAKRKGRQPFQSSAQSLFGEPAPTSNMHSNSDDEEDDEHFEAGVVEVKFEQDGNEEVSGKSRPQRQTREARSHDRIRQALKRSPNGASQRTERTTERDSTPTEDEDLDEEDIRMELRKIRLKQQLKRLQKAKAQKTQ